MLANLPSSHLSEMLADQFPESEPFVQFANQNQATVGSDVRSLEIDFEKWIAMLANLPSSHLNHSSCASCVAAACNMIQRIIGTSFPSESFEATLTTASAIPSANTASRFTAATMLANLKSIKFS